MLNYLAPLGAYISNKERRCGGHGRVDARAPFPRPHPPLHGLGLADSPYSMGERGEDAVGWALVVARPELLISWFWALPGSMSYLKCIALVGAR